MYRREAADRELVAQHRRQARAATEVQAEAPQLVRHEAVEPLDVIELHAARKVQLHLDRVLVTPMF